MNESVATLIKPGHEIKNEYQNMRVKDLKNILTTLPDDMLIIIPVIDEDDANHIYGFRHVRTAGVLTCESEQDREVLCLNAAAYYNHTVVIDSWNNIKKYKDI